MEARLPTVGVHDRLQVFVLGDDVGDLPDRQVSVFVLLKHRKHKAEIELTSGDVIVILRFTYVTYYIQVI